MNCIVMILKILICFINLKKEQNRYAAPHIGNSKFQTLIERDLFQTIRDLVEQLDIHYLSVCNHLCALGKIKYDKWVCHILTEQNLKNQLEVCTPLLSLNRTIQIFNSSDL